jgi:hypothetical protein
MHLFKWFAVHVYVQHDTLLNLLALVPILTDLIRKGHCTRVLIPVPHRSRILIIHQSLHVSRNSSELIPTRSGIMCLQSDNVGGNLTSATISPGANGSMTCIYDKYNECRYSAAVWGSLFPSIYLPMILGSDQDGTKIWGASSCPPSSAPGSGPVGSVPMAADDDIPSSGQDESFAAAGAIIGSPSTDTQSNIPNPIIIALLAMNGLLVIGVLLLGGLWIPDRRSTPSRSREYKKVDATRGLDHDSYYDAPDLPYRPPSRM